MLTFSSKHKPGMSRDYITSDAGYLHCGTTDCSRNLVLQGWTMLNEIHVLLMTRVFVFKTGQAVVSNSDYKWGSIWGKWNLIVTGKNCSKILQAGEMRELIWRVFRKKILALFSRKKSEVQDTCSLTIQGITWIQDNPHSSGYIHLRHHLKIKKK